MGLDSNFACDLLAEDWEQFEPVMAKDIHRIPAQKTQTLISASSRPRPRTLANSPARAGNLPLGLPGNGGSSASDKLPASYRRFLGRLTQ